jgi:diketogulonate reductase-like aldo/keto reductase
VIDVYLVQWPVRDRRLLSWRVVEHLLEAGRVRAIGVSDCMVTQLDQLLTIAEFPPAVNQFELSPCNWASRGDVLDLCADNEIAIEACNPLTRGRMLGDPALLALAKAYGKSAAQVLIRWARCKRA